MGDLAIVRDRLFRPFEGEGYRYPIAIFRIGFFAALSIHFFPALLDLDENYGSLAVRTQEWNRWLFENLPRIPHGILRAWSILTMVACVAAMVGAVPRISAFITGVGLYAFASFNGVQLQTLALTQVWAILPLWAILGGGNCVLSVSSLFRSAPSPQPRLLPALVVFQILIAVVFSGIEKVLAGWPLSNELRILFSYPPGTFVRDWVTSSPWLARRAVSAGLSWGTLIVELGTPILMLVRSTRVPALVAYQAFFLATFAMIAVPPLFYCIFAFGGLLVLDDRYFRWAGARPEIGRIANAALQHNGGAAHVDIVDMGCVEKHDAWSI